MEKYRLFVGCSFSQESKNLRSYITEQIQAQGSFLPIFGDSPDVTKPPASKVRELIASCHAALIVATAERADCATPWVSSELGMAYQQRLPILALVDKQVTDSGIVQYAVCFEEFDAKDFVSSRNQLWADLGKLEDAVTEMGADIKTPENILKRNFTRILPEMLVDLQAHAELHPEVLSKFKHQIQLLLSDAAAISPVYAESDPFAEKLGKSRAAKQAIADYIHAHFLSSLHDTEQQVIVDSGTVTFTICEKLVQEACLVTIVTNNMAVGRRLSEIPRYPCFILPGRLESRYLASLGKETEDYLREQLQQGKAKYGLIAATSFTAEHGIAGNDPRHGSFKKVILEECPSPIIAFEGEKIIEENGIPIYSDSREWQQVLDRRKSELFIVTHRPEQWERLGDVQKKVYERTIETLKKRLGEKQVIELPRVS